MTSHDTSPCDHNAPALSALLDDELPHVARLEAIDHLAACATCRRFYRRARDLDGWIGALAADGADEPVSGTLWTRVAQAADLQPPAIAAPRRAWLPSVAAITLLAFGLWLTDALRPAPPPGQALEVQLEADRGRMTEQRFVALTSEVLRADRRYHAKMLEVMTTVAERTRSLEGTSGDRIVQREADHEPETSRNRTVR